MTGAIVVLRPSLDVSNLPLHVVIPDTDPNGDRFTTDEDVSPNDPVFFRRVINHQRGIKQATEVAQGQFLLQLRQQCIAVSQTDPNECVDVPVNRRSPTTMGAVNALPSNEQTLIYPDPLPNTQNVDSDNSNISRPSHRANRFLNISPPSTPPPMSPHSTISIPNPATPIKPTRTTFKMARLSPTLTHNELPPPIVPTNPDTQHPYHVSVG
uniref:Uncharacterized protein n=1 Tax=Moniliophthora roreri TaxID=221103 RepID=A0A0W0FK98_MONRR